LASRGGPLRRRAGGRSGAEGPDQLPRHEEPRRRQLFSSCRSADDAAVKTLQSRDFFKAYQAKTREVAANGNVTVTPVDVIAATAG
jgi:hypothetical protein